MFYSVANVARIVEVVILDSVSRRQRFWFEMVELEILLTTGVDLFQEAIGAGLAEVLPDVQSISSVCGRRRGWGSPALKVGHRNQRDPSPLLTNSSSKV